MRACVLIQKSEEAPASSASLLATPMSQVFYMLQIYFTTGILYPKCLLLSMSGIIPRSAIYS